MLKKFISNMEKNEKGVFLSKPIALGGRIVYSLPEELKKQGEKQEGPDQGNLKPKGIYKGIESGSDIWIERACEVAYNSVKRRGGPFGALILQIDKETNEIIRYWENSNQVTEGSDPTAHAEIMAIRSACKSLGVFNLGEIKKEDSLLEQPGEESYCVIYSSSEPCPMCYSAISWARIPVLLFAATRFDAEVPGVDFSDEEIYEELDKHYRDRKIRIYQCNTKNSLEAFKLWKKIDKTKY